MIMCNDIENNLDETVMPSFTEDDIVNIDRHYNEQVHQVRDANILPRMFNIIYVLLVAGCIATGDYNYHITSSLINEGSGFEL